MSSKIRIGKDGESGRVVECKRTELDGRMSSVSGGTGTGKSLFLSGLAKQFIQPYGRREFDPVVVINFSEDLAFFNLIKDEMKRLGREEQFKWLSLDPLDETHHFDPLQSFAAMPGSLSRKANFVCGGLNIAYAEGFGSGYFSRLNLAKIRESIERLEAKSIFAPTIDDLALELKAMAKSQRGGKDAAEALYALDTLRDYECLRPAARAEDNLDLAIALEECQVLYFFLPTLQEGLTARAVGTLALWTLINQAAYRLKLGKPKRRIAVFMEEMAQICHGQSFADALTLSRKLGLHLFNSYQSEAQLRGSARNADMSVNMRDNCAIRVSFTTSTEPNSPELRDLQGYSDDVLKTRGGTSRRHLTETTTTQEFIEPKLERNDVLDVNRQFGHGYWVKDWKEPVHLKIDFPTSIRKHEELSNRPIPTKPIAPGSPTGATNGGVRTKPVVSDPEHKSRLAKLNDLIGQITREQTWEATT